MAPGAFAWKLGEVIDDAHTPKCKTKNPLQNASISYNIQQYRIYYVSVHRKECNSLSMCVLPPLTQSAQKYIL